MLDRFTQGDGHTLSGEKEVLRSTWYIIRHLIRKLAAILQEQQRKTTEQPLGLSLFGG